MAQGGSQSDVAEATAAAAKAQGGSAQVQAAAVGAAVHAAGASPAAAAKLSAEVAIAAGASPAEAARTRMMVAAKNAAEAEAQRGGSVHHQALAAALAVSEAGGSAAESREGASIAALVGGLRQEAVRHAVAEAGDAVKGANVEEYASLAGNAVLEAGGSVQHVAQAAAEAATALEAEQLLGGVSRREAQAEADPEQIAAIAARAAMAAVQAMGGDPEEAATAAVLEAQRRGGSIHTQENAVQAALEERRGATDMDAVAARAAQEVADSLYGSTAEMGIAAAAAMVLSGNPMVNTPEGGAAACAKILREQGCNDEYVAVIAGAVAGAVATGGGGGGVTPPEEAILIAMKTAKEHGGSEEAQRAAAEKAAFLDCHAGSMTAVELARHRHELHQHIHSHFEAGEEPGSFRIEPGITARVKARILAFVDNKVRRSLTSWIAHVAGMNRQKMLVRGGVNRMRSRVMSQAWETWREAVQIRRLQEETTRNAVQTMRNRQLAAAFTKWSQVWSQSILQGANLSSATRKLLNGKLHRAMLTWQGHVAEIRREVTLLRSCMGKMQHRSLHMAFGRWEAVVKAAKERLTLDQVARRFLNRKLFAALSKWRDSSWIRQSKEAQNRRALALQAIGSMQNRALARGWATWREEFLRSRELDRLLRGVVHYFRNRGVVLAFKRWQEWWVDVAAQEASLRQALQRIIQRSLAAAWGSWRRGYVEDRASIQLLTKAAAALGHRRIAESFRTWRELASDLKYQKMIGMRIVLRLQSRQLARAFEHWRGACLELMEQDISMKNALVRLVKRKLAMAFMAWRGKAQGSAAQISQARRVVLHMRHRAMSAAFQKWRLDGVRHQQPLYLKVTIAACRGEYQGSLISIKHDIVHQCGLKAGEMRLQTTEFSDEIKATGSSGTGGSAAHMEGEDESAGWAREMQYTQDRVTAAIKDLPLNGNSGTVAIRNPPRRRGSVDMVGLPQRLALVRKESPERYPSEEACGTEREDGEHADYDGVREAVARHRAVTVAMHQHRLATSDHYREQHSAQGRMQDEPQEQVAFDAVTEAMSNHRAVTTAMHEYKVATSEQYRDDHMAAAQDEQSEAEEQAAYAAVTVAMDNHRAVTDAVNKRRDRVMAEAEACRAKEDAIASGSSVTLTFVTVSVAPVQFFSVKRAAHRLLQQGVGRGGFLPVVLVECGTDLGTLNGEEPLANRAWKMMRTRRVQGAFDTWRLSHAASADEMRTLSGVILHMAHKDLRNAFLHTWRQGYLTDQNATSCHAQAVRRMQSRGLSRCFLQWRSTSDPRHWLPDRHRMWCQTILVCIAGKPSSRKGGGAVHNHGKEEQESEDYVPAHLVHLMVHPAELWRYLAHGVSIANHVIHVSRLGSPLKKENRKAAAAAESPEALRQFVRRTRRGESAAMDWSSRIETVRASSLSPWVQDLSLSEEGLMDEAVYEEARLNPADRRERAARRGRAGARGRSLSSSPSRWGQSDDCAPLPSRRLLERGDGIDEAMLAALRRQPGFEATDRNGDGVIDREVTTLINYYHIWTVFLK